MPDPRLTKIVATLGPSCNDAQTIEALIAAGVNCFRLNFSHGSLAEHQALIRRVRAAQRRAKTPVALLADLQGPKLRIGKLDQPRMVTDGEMLVLVGKGDRTDSTQIELDFAMDLAEHARRGTRVLINDGAVVLRVERASGRGVRCRVVEGGLLSPRKGVNLLGVDLPIPCMTRHDHACLRMALEHGVDWVALSFVRCDGDVQRLRRRIRAQGSHAKIISKIERAEAIERLDAILAVSDGVMVARGDLGVEVGVEDVPMLQKRILTLANRAGCTTMTATQMLESMITNPHPTRAEASDVANAVLDGTDAVMLSAETAAGAHPIAAVQTMDRIVRSVERQTAFEAEGYVASHGQRGISQVLAHAACDIAESANAAAIVVPTESGASACEVARYRPMRRIVAASSDAQILQQLQLVRAVVPLHVPPTKNVEHLWQVICRQTRSQGLAVEGETIVATAGRMVNTAAATNTIAVLPI